MLRFRRRKRRLRSRFVMVTKAATRILMPTDLLLFTNSFSIDTVYQRASTCQNLVRLTSRTPNKNSWPRARRIQTPDSRLTEESLYQSICFQDPLCDCDQRALSGAATTQHVFR